MGGSGYSAHGQEVMWNVSDRGKRWGRGDENGVVWMSCDALKGEMRGKMKMMCKADGCQCDRYRSELKCQIRSAYGIDKNVETH